MDDFLLLRVEQKELDDPPYAPEWYAELMHTVRSKGLQGVGQD